MSVVPSRLYFLRNQHAKRKIQAERSGEVAAETVEAQTDGSISLFFGSVHKE